MSTSSGEVMATFEEAVNAERRQIKSIAGSIQAMKDKVATEPENDKENRGEVMANLMLAYRHLEDASMRLGKVLQARDGGVSVYDKESTVGA